jgi:hypothetical protein
VIVAVLLAGSTAILLTAACGPDGARPQGSRTFERQLPLEDSAATSASVSIGDLNGDGHLDIVLVKGRHWPLVDPVLMGNGDGTFEAVDPLTPTADRSYSGVLLDLDRDGDLDVVVSNDLPDPKVVHLNDGTGRFTLGSTFGEPEWSTRYVSTADLDGDGLPDVVLANRHGNESGPSYICFGGAAGAFGECVAFAEGSATTISPADFDGDGHVDLAYAYRDEGQSFVYLNDGAGEFPERRPFGPSDAAIRSARAADLDGDGFLDLAVIDERTGPAVIRGGADVTFGVAEPLGDVDARPYAIAVADVDRDGRTDVIVGYVEARPVVYFNDLGGFTAVPFGDDQGVAYGFAFGDMDEDGFMDIAMARSDAVNILYFGAPESEGAGAGR